MSARLPPSVRVSGCLVALQGLLGLALAVTLVVRGLGGADQRVVNGFGTATWFFVAGSGVLAAGGALFRGRRWGRGLAVFTELLLLPVAWYLAAGSHRPLFGVLVAVVAVSVLAMLFSPAAVRWAAGGQPRPASSAKAGPDSR